MFESRYGDDPFDDMDFRWARFSILAHPLSAGGELALRDAVLPFRILLGGFVTNLALLLGPFLRSAEAMRLATAVYWQFDCRLTQAKHGRLRSHFVLRSTHSRHDKVGLLRFCFGLAGLSSEASLPFCSGFTLSGTGGNLLE